MYLKHFGLSVPPFSMAPATGFFFPGAGRGAMLEALIYATTHSDGIIKVTSEVGSGKTMFCRMLLDRLPENVETIYLPNPAVSREEVLHAVAAELGFECAGLGASPVLRRVQNALVEKYAQGKQVVVLIDEAHAMPCESLEELRLLYNLESSSGKLLQIVLFGQTELDEKLDLPRMRQLKDRIVHHFSIRPMNFDATREYLGFRMRTAGFSGKDPFDRGAVQSIHRESGGLARRINILSDKALLAAYVEGSDRVRARHARMAIRDSGSRSSPKTPFLLLVLLLFSWPLATGRPDIPADAFGEKLRTSVLAFSGKRGYTIRLLEVGGDRKPWLEAFLRRARGEIDAESIYVYPAREGYVVAYGIYPSRIRAKIALRRLPKAYRKAYRPQVLEIGVVANS